MRAFRLASWVLIVPTLSLFSFSVVASASGFGAKPDYAGAVRDVDAGKHGAYLVVHDGGGNPIERIFAHGAQQVCWISSSELARVSQKWATGRLTISYGRRSLTLVTVSGARESDLRAEIGNVSCVLVQVARTFYLPFEAHGS